MDHWWNWSDIDLLGFFLLMKPFPQQLLFYLENENPCCVKNEMEPITSLKAEAYKADEEK